MLTRCEIELVEVGDNTQSSEGSTEIPNDERRKDTSELEALFK
jgi:hypothetical protein